MDQMIFEKLIYEIARCWGINDRDLTIDYKLLQELGCVDIVAILSIPYNEDFPWMDFWSDVSNHVSQQYDVIIFVEPKRTRVKK